MTLGLPPAKTGSGIFDLPEPDPLTGLERRYLDAEEAGDYRLADRLAAQIDQPQLRTRQRLGQPGALGESAYWYASKQIAVFPLQPGGKEPLTRHGFKDASCDPATITSWWNRWPEANIGAATGRHLDVIDIDGLAGLRTWIERDLQVRTIGHAITPRGGGHHLYVPPQGLGNRSKRWAGHDLPGLDYRGAGGYVVLPPSRSAEHNRRWSWLAPIRTEWMNKNA